jgi:recombinational DNA repair protein RecR
MGQPGNKQAHGGSGGRKETMNENAPPCGILKVIWPNASCVQKKPVTRLLSRVCVIVSANDSQQIAEVREACGRYMGLSSYISLVHGYKTTDETCDMTSCLLKALL